jgi:hypothetical protein
MEPERGGGGGNLQSEITDLQCLNTPQLHHLITTGNGVGAGVRVASVQGANVIFALRGCVRSGVRPPYGKGVNGQRGHGLQRLGTKGYKGRLK